MGGGLGFPVRSVLLVSGIAAFLYLAVFYLRHPQATVHKYAIPMLLLAAGEALVLIGDGLNYVQSEWSYAGTLMVAGVALVAAAVGIYVRWDPRRRQK